MSARQGVDWSPLLQKTPQYEVFLKPPADQQFYLEPVLAPLDEIESRDRRPASRRLYVDPSLKDNPTKQAAIIHRWAQQTDQLLKDADLYGTT